jgi:hypothetical protein
MSKAFNASFQRLVHRLRPRPGVETHDRHVYAFQRGGKVAARVDRSADPRVDALDRISRADHGANTGVELQERPYSPCRRRSPKNSRPNTRPHARPRGQRAAARGAIRCKTPCRSLRAFVSPFRPAQHRLSISGARHLTSSICRFARCSPPFSIIVRTIDSELRLVAALRHAAGERGGPLPSDQYRDSPPQRAHL